MFSRSFETQSLTKYLLLFVALLSLSACSKKQEPVAEEPIDEFSYEVECVSCEITYTDKSNVTKTVKHSIGKWEYRFAQRINFELKLSIKTTLASQQTINAYILKNKETVYGNTGYNYADITYNTQNAKGTNSFGSYRNSEPGNGGNNNGGGTPSSSVCGARTKSGGSCKRMVVGGGRCWQHR